MRLTSLLHQLLGLEYTRVLSCQFVEDGLEIDVAPTWRAPRCSSCGYTCRGYDRQRGRRWRHLDAGGMKLYLRYNTRRVDCVRCGVTVEHLPWAEVGSWFTRPFENQVGYLAQRSDKTTVSKLMRIAWTTVGDLIQRVVVRHQRADALDGLTHIGVDASALTRIDPPALVRSGPPRRSRSRARSFASTPTNVVVAESSNALGAERRGRY